jgi:hypothetical protein
MTDKVNEAHSIIVACDDYVTSLRNVILDVDLDSLGAFLDVGQEFQSIVEIASTDSFVSIGRSVNTLVRSCVDSESHLTQLENETLELAADWLDQLARLYREGLPEPKALVKELLYTFELVGRSHGAISLSELLSHQKDEGPSTDMFAQDPDLESNNYHSPKQEDPFDGDPGFGMEFDLLQRTLTLSDSQGVVTDDIFTDDDHFDVRSCGDNSIVADLPFDVFEDDPQPEDQ